MRKVRMFDLGALDGGDEIIRLGELGKRWHNYGKSLFFNGKIHYKLPFSIATAFPRWKTRKEAWNDEFHETSCRNQWKFIRCFTLIDCGKPKNRLSPKSSFSWYKTSPNGRFMAMGLDFPDANPWWIPLFWDGWKSPTARPEGIGMCFINGFQSGAAVATRPCHSLKHVG